MSLTMAYFPEGANMIFIGKLPITGPGCAGSPATMIPLEGWEVPLGVMSFPVASMWGSVWASTGVAANNAAAAKPLQKFGVQEI